MATTHKESTLILGGRPRNLRKCETTDRQKMMAGDEGMQNGAYSFFLPPEIKHSGRRPVHLKGYASRFEYSKFSASRHGLNAERAGALPLTLEGQRIVPYPDVRQTKDLLDIGISIFT